MRSTSLAAISLVLSGWCTLFAQGETDSLPDSSRTATTDTLPLDTAVTAHAETIDDSIRIVFPRIDPDTLNVNQRMLVEFETRFTLRQREAPPVEAKDRFSYSDSLAAYYVSPRQNLREDIDRSFYHDAGDYLRSDPSFFVLEPQATPMRKTVQPYGLSGDRLGIVRDGLSIKPFEHVVEPDGLVDMNDLPTALDYTVAAVPGPVGMIFGADHSVASLVTFPRALDSTNPRSCFLVDKGDYSYSHARGRYAKNFLDGRHVDLSIEYRKSDGVVTGRADDAYHYTGNFLFPLGEKWAVETEGRLYNRDGDYPVFSPVSAARLERYRIDRAAYVTLSRQNENRDGRYLLSYRHLRQGSDLDGLFRLNLDQTGHRLEIGREWLSGSTLWRSGVAGDFLEYNSWFEKHSRLSGLAYLDLARLTRPWGYAATAKVWHVEDFGFLPAVSVLLKRDAEKSFYSFSAGYSERAPHLNELYLPPQNARMYGGDSYDYFENGNSNLISEKMLQGAIELSLGRPDNSVTVTATGGKIWDGIDWLPRMSDSKLLFVPGNGDITWSSVSGTGRMRIADFLRLKGGGSFHHSEYELTDQRPYAPEYQTFSGLELHLYWRQKLIDFWAYGELVYVGPYDGFRQDELGDVAVVNVKLSFKMGNFRFHWISQNSLMQEYYPRDYWRVVNYTTYYGFTWDFFD
jgi:hypothetical protein